jgi:hypothetical protein
MRAVLLDCLTPIARLSDENHVRFGAKDRGNSFAQHRMIVYG